MTPGVDTAVSRKVHTEYSIQIVAVCMAYAGPSANGPAYGPVYFSCSSPFLELIFDSRLWHRLYGHVACTLLGRSLSTVDRNCCPACC